MKNDLRTVLSRIENDYKENILDDSRYYVEISIARKAEELGFDEVKKRYKDAYAIVPLKHSVGGMKVRIDGRTFVNFAQFDSGVVVPRYVASQVDEPHRAYVAKDSMICNFAQHGESAAVWLTSNANHRGRVLEKIVEAHRFMESNPQRGNIFVALN